MPDNEFLPLPTPPMDNDIDIEEAPPTPRLQGIALEAYSNVGSFAEDLGINKLSELATREFDPGRTMSSEEYEKSIYKVPGLNFPTGVPLNVARSRSNRYQDKLETQELLGNMEPGFLSFASRRVGDFIALAIGSALPSTKLLGAVSRPLLGGKLFPWLATKLESSSWKLLAAKGAVGVAEGGVIAVPFALSQYKNDLDLGQDDGYLSLVANEALGAGLGGAYRMGFGFDPPLIAPEEHQNAIDAATVQMFNGKPAYVEPLIENGAYQSAKDSALIVARSGAKTDELTMRLREIDTQLGENRAQIKTDFGKNKIGTELMDFPEGEKLSPKLETMFAKHREFWTEDEQKAFDTFRSSHVQKVQPTILNKLFNFSEKGVEKRSLDEQNIINDFKEGREEEAIQGEVDEIKSKKSTLQTRLETAETPKEKTKLRFKISDLEKAEDLNKDRLGNVQKLTNLIKENPEFAERWEETQNLLNERNQKSLELTANKSYAQVMSTYADPVKEADLRSAHDWTSSWKSDLFYEPDLLTASNEELRDIPDDISTDEREVRKMETSVNELRNEGKLAPEEEEILDGIEKDEAQHNKIAGALKSYVECLIGRGEE